MDPAAVLGPAGVFRDAVDVADATWARGRGRVLSMALVQMPCHRRPDTVVSTDAHHVIREVLAE